MVQQMQTQAVETESEKRKRLRQEEAEAFADLVLGDEEMLIETTKKTLGVLADLNSAFEGDSEKEQKKRLSGPRRYKQPKPSSLPTRARCRRTSPSQAFPLSDLYSVVLQPLQPSRPD